MSRHDAPYLLMRYGPPIGRPDHPPRIAVAYQAYSLEEALQAGRGARGWPTGRAWIVRRDRPAHRRQR
jgi:hypothetical protein